MKKTGLLLLLICLLMGCEKSETSESNWREQYAIQEILRWGKDREIIRKELTENTG